MRVSLYAVSFFCCLWRMLIGSLNAATRACVAAVCTSCDVRRLLRRLGAATGRLGSDRGRVGTATGRAGFCPCTKLRGFVSVEGSLSCTGDPVRPQGGPPTLKPRAYPGCHCRLLGRTVPALGGVGGRGGAGTRAAPALQVAGTWAGPAATWPSSSGGLTGTRHGHCGGAVCAGRGRVQLHVLLAPSVSAQESPAGVTRLPRLLCLGSAGRRRRQDVSVRQERKARLLPTRGDAGPPLRQEKGAIDAVEI